jgi:hypothetical protein
MSDFGSLEPAASACDASDSGNRAAAAPARSPLPSDPARPQHPLYSGFVQDQHSFASGRLAVIFGSKLERSDFRQVWIEICKPTSPIRDPAYAWLRLDTRLDPASRDTRSLEAEGKTPRQQLVLRSNPAPTSTFPGGCNSTQASTIPALYRLWSFPPPREGTRG